MHASLVGHTGHTFFYPAPPSVIGPDQLRMGLNHRVEDKESS